MGYHGVGLYPVSIGLRCCSRGRETVNIKAAQTAPDYPEHDSTKNKSTVVCLATVVKRDIYSANIDISDEY